MSMLIPFIIIGIGVGVFIFLMLRTILLPKRIASIRDLLNQEKYNQVIKACKKIIEKNHKNAEAHYILGMAYLKSNRPELALMELKLVNSIGIFTDYCPEKEFRETIAKLFKEFNQIEEALKEYLLLIKKFPSNSLYYLNAGELFEERNQQDKAFIYYKKAADIDPRNSRAFYKIGVSLYRMRKTQEAKKYLEKAIQLDQSNLKAYYYIGRIAKENKDYRTALIALEKSLRDPEYKIRSLVERGACYMSMGDYDTASLELERAIKLSKENTSPEFLYSKYFLSICYEKLRRMEEAITQWEEIYEINPKFQDVAERLSQYQDIRQDDRIKDFLTCSDELFMEICKGIITALNLSISSIKSIPDGAEIIAIEANKDWRNTKSIPKLIRILRKTEILDESAARNLYESLRQQNIMAGIIITSSPISNLAKQFAETRPIYLYDMEKLRQILKKIDMNTGEFKG
ncbi:tetratricopeptide repeat protein [Spirochaetia bacterium 38H-sp]|uniref:Tetratricopeptide repeat protein n=1 Tax=Rarispira pelagica TaxID=3141764 RepID=A0ABU9UBG1_9SPIR